MQFSVIEKKSNDLYVIYDMQSIGKKLMESRYIGKQKL